MNAPAHLLRKPQPPKVNAANAGGSHADTSTSIHRRPDFRIQAVLLVAASGIVLLVLGFVMQILAWRLLDNFDTELPLLAKGLDNLFGRRPHQHLTSVIFWMWWIMVAATVHCHFCYPGRRTFAIAFFYRFLLCWMAALMVVAIAGAVMGLSFVCLCADLQGPPGFMKVVPIISRALPFAVLLFAGLCWWRYRRPRRSKQ